MKSVGKSVIKGSSNFANNAFSGKKKREGAKQRFEETLEELEGENFER